MTTDLRLLPQTSTAIQSSSVAASPTRGNRKGNSTAVERRSEGTSPCHKLAGRMRTRQNHSLRRDLLACSAPATSSQKPRARCDHCSVGAGLRRRLGPDHAAYRCPRLAGRLQGACLVAIGEDPTVPVELPIDGLGHANAETLQAARQGAPVPRLDEQVELLAVNREENEPEAHAFPPGPKRSPYGAHHGRAT